MKPRTTKTRPRSALRLAISARGATPYAAFLRQHLRKAHEILRPALAELSLALVDDRTISHLHGQYLGIAGPTDVLTFELEHDSRGRVTAGEVVVCVPEARRRAGAEGTDLRRELLLYALHGMLHLCGFDDRTAAGFRRMHRVEDDILRRLGVGAVFSPRAKPTHAKTRGGGR